MDSDSIDRIINEKTENQPKTTQESLNNEYLLDFLTETKEHLESIEMNVLMLESEKDNHDMINSVFRDFHTIKGLAGFVSQSLIQKIAHQTESVLDQCRKGELFLTETLLQYILKSADYIKNICENLHLNEDKELIRQITKHLNQFDNLENKYIDEKEATDTGSKKEMNAIIDSIIGDSENIPVKQKKKEESVHIRIPIQKIDTLVDMIGELIINQSQFEQQAKSFIDNDILLNTYLHRISTITKDIQALSITLRMISLKALFQRIYRIGKDTVSTLGKNVEISLVGEETEIDRGIVEKLVDPLIHLIKNSIYHGIEDESDRIKSGKPPKGHVKIEAYRTKGYVYIVISDDGRGIEPRKILQNAVKKKLIDPLVNYSEEEILELLFMPGFSTLDTADDISGRGVGLDIVKTQITKMGGRIDILNTPGHGCSFKMKLPINTAIMKGTIVEIAGVDYIIPSLSILTVFTPTENHWVSVKGVKNMIKIRDRIIPIIYIEKVLGLKAFDKQNCVIVVIESDQRFIALPVTRIIENKDIIVKSLGPEFDHLSYAFGASILGNGKIAIILDVDSIIQKGE